MGALLHFDVHHVRSADMRCLTARTVSISKNRGRAPSEEVTTSPEAQAYAQAAASKAMYPDQQISLPQVPHESDLSADLEDMKLSDTPSKAPHSETMANRNVIKRKPRQAEARAADAMPSSARSPVGNVKPLAPAQDRYSEDVANWNIVQNQKPVIGGLHDIPAPLQVKKGPLDSRAGGNGSPLTPTTSAESHVLAHKQFYNSLRPSQESARPTSSAVPDRDPRRSVEKGHIKRSSLEKPLPSAPSDEYNAELENDRVLHDSGIGSERGYLVKDSSTPIDVAQVVDLQDSEDTTLHEKFAPAVVHETIVRETHEIREEHVTREIHNHHYFHRILPIVDIEVLPSRHFVPVEGGYAEIAEEEVPGQAGANAQWLVAETVSKLLPKSNNKAVEARHFSARKFAGKEGDYKEYLTPEGVKRTETWWVHPPTLETGARETGQSYAFHFDAANPAKNGLRASLPAGSVVGVSPLLAKQQRERGVAKVHGGGGRGGRVEEEMAPPPVPPHRVFPAEMVDAARAGPMGGVGRRG